MIELLDIWALLNFISIKIFLVKAFLIILFVLLLEILHFEIFFQLFLMLFIFFFLKSLKQTWFHFQQSNHLDFLIIQQILFAELFLDWHLIFFVCSNQLQLVSSNRWCYHNQINILLYNPHVDLLLTFLFANKFW